jgi:hypothetical protein
MMTPISRLWILWMAWASCSAQTLVIGLYDYSDLSAKETTRLTQAADQAFGHSGIHVVWRHCRGVLAVTPETTCQGKVQDNEIVVRLQPGGLRRSNDDKMGSAIVNADGGTYAIVFVSAVRAQATGFGVSFGILLGYAVAHEAGHCLLGPSHSYAGLMRGAWDRKDAGEISRLSLHLTKQEARKAVAALGAAIGNRASEQAARISAKINPDPLSLSPASPTGKGHPNGPSVIIYVQKDSVRIDWCIGNASSGVASGSLVKIQMRYMPGITKGTCRWTLWHLHYRLPMELPPSQSCTTGFSLSPADRAASKPSWHTCLRTRSATCCSAPTGMSGLA